MKKETGGVPGSRIGSLSARRRHEIGPGGDAVRVE
jgi:hypothetical protein